MIAVDTHVHLHECFDVAGALMSAAENMVKVSEDEVGTPVEYALCLTESEGAHVFRSLAKDAKKGGTLGDWVLQATLEPDSLQVRHPMGHAIWLFAGRQIVTTDNLEVLCLGRDADIADRSASTAKVAQQVAGLGALPVVPWGFGKWKGARGEVVKQLLSESGPRPLWVGDNSGRLQLGAEPELFGVARAAGIGVLPGSDPLPFARQEGVLGRYTALFDGTLQPEAPFETLRHLVEEAGSEIRCSGHREGVIPFCINQVAMQIRKRLCRGK